MHLRLLADDLTGALDSAARFVPVTGAIAVRWDTVPHDAPAATDTGTRELPVQSAAAVMERFAPLLDDGAPAFKKIDSLLRGHVALELRILMRRFDHCVLAPAFPFQGRITRGGRQMIRDDGLAWRDSGVDLPPDLLCYLRDAETDADLAAIVATGRRLPGRVLWCGTGGLAGALAGFQAVPRPALPQPVLALIGSDHQVSLAQLAVVPHLHHVLRKDESLPARAQAVTVAVAEGTSREEARERIGASFASLLGRIERPGTLFVSGGATLRQLCDGLGAAWLEVDGELEPGVPTSVLRGGEWDGQRVVSKSGAFGDTRFLARLFGEQ